MRPISCVVCGDILLDVGEYTDHVRVLHHEDEQALLDPRFFPELRDPSGIRTRSLRLERAAS